MVSTLSKFVAVFAAASAFLYQIVLKDAIWTTLGFGRKLDHIDSFGVRCEKIQGLGLEACEDMWLHEPSGLLYVACSDSASKVQWNPSIDHLNATGRRKQDRMGIIDTRASGPIRFRLKWIKPVNYPGTNGDGVLDLQGFDVQVRNGDPPILHLLLVNNRPPVDPITGSLDDAVKVGANSTIELFSTTLGSTEMHHLKTYYDYAIQTPNNVAFIGEDGAFVASNDKSAKVGFRRQLDAILGGGSIAYCNTTSCHIAASSGFNYPNGLILGPAPSPHGLPLIWVPSPMTGEIQILELQPDLVLRRIKVIKTGYPLDNLSKDSNGDVYGAAFPHLWKTARTFDDPWSLDPPATVLRVRMVESGKEEELDFVVEKVLEDDGSVLPGATVAIHDPGKPERWFLGGVLSPFITICEAL